MRSNASSKIYNVYIFLKYGATPGGVGHGLGGGRPNCGYRCITVKGGLRARDFRLWPVAAGLGPVGLRAAAGGLLPDGRWPAARTRTGVGVCGAVAGPAWGGVVRGVLAGAVASRVRSWRGWRCLWASPPGLRFWWWWCLPWELLGGSVWHCGSFRGFG